MVPFMLPSHTTGTENIVSLQCSGADRQEVAHGTILVGMHLRVRDHVRLNFPVCDTPPLASSWLVIALCFIQSVAKLACRCFMFNFQMKWEKFVIKMDGTWMTFSTKLDLNIWEFFYYLLWSINVMEFCLLIPLLRITN